MLYGLIVTRSMTTIRYNGRKSLGQKTCLDFFLLISLPGIYFLWPDYLVFFVLPQIIALEQGSVHFFCKERQIVNILGFITHVVFCHKYSMAQL